MKTGLLLTAALLGITAISYSSNEKNDSNEIQTRLLNPVSFYGLVSNANANIIIQQSANNSIKVEGTQSQLEKIQTRISEGTLSINGYTDTPVTIYLSARELNLIEVAGNSKVVVNGILNTDILLLKANENGSIKVDVHALKAGLIAKGKGRLFVSGSCGDFFTRISDQGIIHADKLESFSRTDENSNVKTMSKSANQNIFNK